MKKLFTEKSFLKANFAGKYSRVLFYLYVVFACKFILRNTKTLNYLHKILIYTSMGHNHTYSKHCKVQSQSYLYRHRRSIFDRVIK